ncbi:uncharacterized protein LOC130939800 [Arachis stenosperma]|uniref:uncharacterized protein LOC130939800 n=1 Tax=Arachis stenosperma TaxID=217475 RepID=UPI0025AC2EE1|nr:uncharacterized protein LOC130939800 [Arachis stenosperma]
MKIKEGGGLWCNGGEEAGGAKAELDTITRSLLEPPEFEKGEVEVVPSYENKEEREVSSVRRKLRKTKKQIKKLGQGRRREIKKTTKTKNKKKEKKVDDREFIWKENTIEDGTDDDMESKANKTWLVEKSLGLSTMIDEDAQKYLRKIDEDARQDSGGYSKKRKRGPQKKNDSEIGVASKQVK